MKPANRPAGRRSPPNAETLPEDDREIWSRVSQSVSPLKAAKPRVPDVEPPAPPPRSHQRLPPGNTRANPPPPDANSPTAAGPKRRHPPTSAPPQLKSPRQPALPAAPAVFDRRHARRIAKGDIEIEARLDLHGLTQSAAHDRLVGFLSRAAASGLRTVLVITGKGGSWRRAGSGDLHRAGDIDTGVLRRNVPRWLAEPALKAIITTHGTAARHHGGDGAFYIQLRRRRPSGA